MQAAASPGAPAAQAARTARPGVPGAVARAVPPRPAVVAAAPPVSTWPVRPPGRSSSWVAVVGAAVPAPQVWAGAVVAARRPTPAPTPRVRAPRAATPAVAGAARSRRQEPRSTPSLPLAARAARATRAQAEATAARAPVRTREAPVAVPRPLRPMAEAAEAAGVSPPVAAATVATVRRAEAAGVAGVPTPAVRLPTLLAFPPLATVAAPQAAVREWLAQSVLSPSSAQALPAHECGGGSSTETKPAARSDHRRRRVPGPSQSGGDGT